MNFFAQQAKARSNTTRLVVLFAMAIFCLICITLLFLVFILSNFHHHTLHEEFLNAGLVIDVSAAIIAVVLIAWAWKSLQLSRGGQAIVDAMGATHITGNTADPHERKILNVVEEMAIASGIPVPPVYVFEENGINAFAAGYTIKDAVIGISRGCIVNLNRDELQGVIAHEFSHIFNGDMRLNIRLISVLHGILVIGLIGEFLMRSTDNRSYSSRDDRSGIAGIFITGLGLTVIGYAGTFFGNLIKAAVSRQREFLADASAVQFTRNPDGIGNALKKIGGYPLGSFVRDPQAHEISHFFFNQAVNIRFAGWMATHPPLEERIRCIDSHWDGKFIKVVLPEEDKINPHLLRPSRQGIKIDPDAYRKPEAQEELSPLEFLTDTLPVTLSAISYTGAPTPQHVVEAQRVLESIPEQLKKLARDNYDVQALVYCLLLDKTRAEIHEKQLNDLREKLPADIYREVMRIKDIVSTIPPRHRLPLMSIAVNTLRQLSVTQYQDFKANLMMLIKADNVIDLFEWSLYRMISHHLDSKSNTDIGYKSLESLQYPCRLLLSAIAVASSENTPDAAASFARAWQTLALPTSTLASDCLQHILELDKALKQLHQLHPLKKPLFIKACCAALYQEEDPEGIEIIYTIVNSLDVPMPPLLANQKIC